MPTNPARTCPDCGQHEIRLVTDGRASVNLEPHTGCCLPCLIARSKEQRMLDYKLAQAGKDE